MCSLFIYVQTKSVILPTSPYIFPVDKTITSTIYISTAVTSTMYADYYNHDKHGLSVRREREGRDSKNNIFTNQHGRKRAENFRE